MKKNKDSSLSRAFIRKMDASPDVRIHARCHSMAEAKELIKRQEVYGIVRIPSTFDRDIWLGGQTHVGLYCDMCSMLYYKALMLTATNVSLEINKDIKVERHLPATTDRQEEIIRMPIEYDYIALYNPQSGFAAFLIPPVLMLIIQQTLLLGIGMSAGDTRERWQGSFLPFHRAYKHPLHIVTGKMLFALLRAGHLHVHVRHLLLFPAAVGRLRHLSCLPRPLPAGMHLSCDGTFGAGLSARRLHHAFCVPLRAVAVPVGHLLAGCRHACLLEIRVVALPPTFGMNGYVRIQGMGASLHDVAFEYIGLWIQTGVYFLLACLLYRQQITRFIRKRGSV